MKLHALHAGGERADMSIFDPFHPELGTKVVIPYFVYLIEHPQGNVLFDSGGHPDLIDKPDEYLGAAADAFEVVMEPGDDVVSRLATIGISPGDVEHVAHSHLHYDHAGGVQFFPDATFYIQERELQFAYWPPVYQRDIYLKSDFDHDVNWFELEGEHDIFGDGKLILFPTPGHSAGHQSLLVRLDGGSVILVADASYSPRNIGEDVLPALLWSPDAMISSYRRVREVQRRENAKLIFTHDLDYETTTKLAPREHYE
jgi:glyoxylase-like metal-dependent hydrolase (beta-lactamase superfamily II)